MAENSFEEQSNSPDCVALLARFCTTTEDALLIFDKNGMIRACNAQCAALFGYDQPVLIRHTIKALMPALDDLVTDSERLHQKTTAQRRDETSFMVDVTITPFNEPQTLFLAIIRESDDICIEDVVLSPRQHQILQLVTEGLTSRQIADRLTISIKTVETHRANIMNKLGVKNVSSLVRYAIEHDII